MFAVHITEKKGKKAPDFVRQIFVILGIQLTIASVIQRNKFCSFPVPEAKVQIHRKLFLFLVLLVQKNAIKMNSYRKRRMLLV